jgi:hypothetical protein
LHNLAYRPTGSTASFNASHMAYITNSFTIIIILASFTQWQHSFKPFQQAIISNNNIITATAANIFASYKSTEYTVSSSAFQLDLHMTLGLSCGMCYGDSVQYPDRRVEITYPHEYSISARSVFKVAVWRPVRSDACTVNNSR